MTSPGYLNKGPKELGDMAEQTPLLPNAVDRSRREQHWKRRLLHLILVSLLIVLLHWRFRTSISSYHEVSVHPSHGDRVNDPTFFNWTAHLPSKILNWTDCYDSFQCARLTVPLAYSEPSGDEGAVALIKSPSKYPTGHHRYRGPILFNPGGPGGSGVSQVRSLGHAFRAIIGDEFDLIGFDPRGVGYTTPKISIFESKLELGKFQYQFPMNLNASASALGEAYARAQILGNMAQNRDRFVAERVSTPTVARDMLSIVQATGEEKLQYWGFSYGTILGATFSAMFPDKVGRVIIDGVVDWEDYYNGTWANNLRDTDAVIIDLYQSCVEAGPSKCPIFENSVSLVQARVDSILEELKTTPMLLYSDSTSSGREYEIIDYGLVKSTIFKFLYSPHENGARLLHALAALEQGDPSAIYAISLKRLFSSLIECNCSAPMDSAPEYEYFDTTYTIACGDSLRGEEDLIDLRRAYEEMARTSEFADSWEPRVFCSTWKLRAKERFQGPFEAQHTTGHPLLLIGNVADPVTPLSNAHKMSKIFKDSVVLTQDSPGHCSYAASSLCTAKAVREYFINGTLPEKGTICDVQSSVFGGDLMTEALSMEDRQLLEASHMLQNTNYFVPTLGSGIPLRRWV